MPPQLPLQDALCPGFVRRGVPSTKQMRSTRRLCMCARKKQIHTPAPPKLPQSPPPPPPDKTHTSLNLYLKKLTGVPVLRELPGHGGLLAAADPPSHLRVVPQQSVVQQRPVVQVLRGDVVHGSRQEATQHRLIFKKCRFGFRFQFRFRFSWSHAMAEQQARHKTCPKREERTFFWARGSEKRCAR